MIALAWLLKNWRLAALGACVAGVLGFVGLAMHWRSDALQTHAQLDVVSKALKACIDRSKALEGQIKAQAIEEGKRYEKTEADHLAACADAYRAGARKLRDDQAIAAGRYLSKPRPGLPSR